MLPHGQPRAVHAARRDIPKRPLAHPILVYRVVNRQLCQVRVLWFLIGAAVDALVPRRQDDPLGIMRGKPC